MSGAGFLFSTYIENVKAALEKAFYVGQEYPIIKSVHFAPTAPYEQDAGQFQAQDYQEINRKISLDPPVIILDPYGLKADPSYDEYNQDRNVSFTNSGDLGIHLFVKALVLISNNKTRDSHIHVRQLAIDIGGVINENRRFGGQVQMSQVTHIQEAALHQYNSHLIGWTIQWQHSIVIEPPDYSNIGIRKAIVDDTMKADAAQVKEITFTVQGGDPQTSFIVESETGEMRIVDKETADLLKKERDGSNS